MKREKNYKVRNIAYVSGTRADFGLMSGVLHDISKSKHLKLHVYATGMHLMPQFGSTINEVKKQYPNCSILPAIFLTDDRAGMAKFFAKLLQCVIGAFIKNKPDIVIVMGDRPEMLCTAVACTYLGIPIAHVHAGDKTTTVDEYARHAITKLAHIHFAATKDASKRIQKMGEESWRIFISGAPALDVIMHKRLPTKNEIYHYINIDEGNKFVLLMLHPVTENISGSAVYMKNVIDAVKSFHLPVVTIYPNADAGGRSMIRIIEKEKNNPLFHLFPSVPYEHFLALEREASVWVGNSSAGMIESASFKTPVVNVGDRQSGRVHANNVRTVSYDKTKIVQAIDYALNNKSYIRSLQSVINPWGDGRAGERIVKVLESIPLGEKLLSKQIIY